MCDFHMKWVYNKGDSKKLRKKYRILRTMRKIFIQTKRFIWERFISIIWDFTQHILS
jgi:hypothetical protein